jgi:GT2 family glycosyltransferase/glycosyltransferase involved in cell wall biosynthesis
VTVLVVAFNSAAVIAECLRALPAALADAAVATTVVVDNASTDTTIGEVHAAAPDALLYRMATNSGYAAAINAGCRFAPGGVGDALLILNPDVRMAPGSMAPLLAALAQPGVGLAVPKLLDGDGRTLRSLRREPTIVRALGEAVLGGNRAGRYARLGEVVTDPAAYVAAGNVDWATGAAMLISRACIDAVGPWDESYFLYSAEVDFALRARDRGHAVRYEPGATAVRLDRRSTADPDRWTQLTRNRVRLYRNRHGRVKSAGFAGAVLLNEAVRAAAGRAANDAALRSLVRRGADGQQTPGGRRHGFVCFSAQDWWYFNRAHSDFQLLTRAARHRPVLLVNSIGMRVPMPGRTRKPWARYARKAASLTKGLRHPLPDVPDFAVLSPVFLPVYRPGRLRDLSTRLVRWQVRRATRRLGIEDPTTIVTLPTAWDVARGLPNRTIVANRSDRYSAFGEADGAWVAGLERALLAEADVAVYASRALLDEEAGLTRRPVQLDHGVDLERFRPASELEEPADLLSIPRPRIGFFGAIDDYTVDLGLLARLADEIPEAQLVLVGPTNCPLGDLTSRPNVHWLGARPPEAVPSYGAGFDVAVMPWIDNDWIRFCNPIKLKEYLALGLPVVTTPFPEVDRYADLVRIGKDAAQFVSLVRQSLLDGGPATPERRRQAVAGDTWDRRALELLALCEQAATHRSEAEAACAAS